VPTSSQEDSRLVARCQGGDLEAFNQLVLKYQDRVFDTVYRMVGEYADAQDLAQACFVKAYLAVGEFRGQSSFYTWLFRIAVNEALSERRRTARGQRHAPTFCQTPEDLGAAAADARTHQPAEAAEQNEERLAVVEALRRLDPEQRAVIVMKDLEGADYGQLAEVFQCPRGTVKSRLHRARQALRKELARLIRA
jgi:RNA polymerase sigma-70 factor (ECF subfamily)